MVIDFLCKVVLYHSLHYCIDVGGGGAWGARAPPAVGLEILSGPNPKEKKKNEDKKKKGERKKLKKKKKEQEK